MLCFLGQRAILDRPTRVFAAAAAVLLAILLLPVSASGQDVRLTHLESVAVGEILGEGESAEEAFFIGDSFIDGLLAMSPGETKDLRSFPVAPGRRESWEIERVAIYAPGTKVWRIAGDQREALNPSGRVFYRGVRANGETLALSLDPSTRRLAGSLKRHEGDFELLPHASSARTLHGVRRRPVSDEEDSFTCENPSHAHVAFGAEDPIFDPEAAFLSQIASRGSGGLRQATIAIDTDIEFIDLKFSNDSSAALVWIEDLFNAINVMYERDLGLRLVLSGTVILRERTGLPGDYDDDPYEPYACPPSSPSNCGIDPQVLYDVGDEWAANHASVDRAFVTFLSGKQGSASSGSGIAWRDGYCEKQSIGGGYNTTQVLRSNSGSAFDANVRLIGHEIGHNAGSQHTHCIATGPGPTDFVDNCFNGDSGCYGYDPIVANRLAPSCPSGSGGKGTVMSYCHFSSAIGGAACGSNLTEFHPTVQSIIEGLMDSHPACIVPLVPVDLIFQDDFETGNASAWDLGL